MPDSSPAPAFTALLFGLSGCLVDFGARTLPIARELSGLADTDDGFLPILQASAQERAETCLLYTSPSPRD